LNVSLLFNFLELVDSLIIDPEGGDLLIAEKIEPIFHNMHHLINTYRPHEARQTLITMMEKQIERRKEFLKSLNENIDMCQNIIIDGKKILDESDMHPRELDLKPQDIFTLKVEDVVMKELSPLEKMIETLDSLMNT